MATLRSRPALGSSLDRLRAGRDPALGGQRTRWVRSRRLGWGLALVALAVLLTYGSLDDRSAPSDAERAAAIARSLRCPQCAGESVAESNVSVAREIRADIARRVDAGQSDEQISAAYAALYGDAILLTPPARGVGSLVWFVPAIVGLTAAAGLGLAFRRWR
ncbi:MAG: cytochrome c-type biogenesis protein CcmH [bacterium]|nr:cytochrome c-type biogenesis protein CcmH [bacterium]